MPVTRILGHGRENRLVTSDDRFRKIHTDFPLKGIRQSLLPSQLMNLCAANLGEDLFGPMRREKTGPFRQP
jgi:hypothetical protein